MFRVSFLKEQEEALSWPNEFQILLSKTKKESLIKTKKENYSLQLGFVFKEEAWNCLDELFLDYRIGCTTKK